MQAFYCLLFDTYKIISILGSPPGKGGHLHNGVNNMTIVNKQDDSRTNTEIMRAKLMLAGFMLSCGREGNAVAKLSETIDMLDTIIAEERALEEARRHILAAKIDLMQRQLDNAKERQQAGEL
jgi:hypothetical protein